MGEDRLDKHKRIINDFIDGKTKLQHGHPNEVEEAIITFFHAGKMLMDNPELQTIPHEYVMKLLEALRKYPQYNMLTLDLINILNGNNN